MFPCAGEKFVRSDKVNVTLRFTTDVCSILAICFSLDKVIGISFLCSFYSLLFLEYALQRGECLFLQLIQTISFLPFERDCSRNNVKPALAIFKAIKMIK